MSKHERTQPTAPRGWQVETQGTDRIVVTNAYATTSQFTALIKLIDQRFAGVAVLTMDLHVIAGQLFIDLADAKDLPQVLAWLIAFTNEANPKFPCCGGSIGHLSFCTRSAPFAN